MKNRRESIRKIISFLNNREEDGGFWLPNIQRPFVWSEDQICRVFDSIMREYPISTLLVWKTTAKVRMRKFIDNWTSKTGIPIYEPEDDKKKCLVLDGQQRLQSLFIALRGSYDGRELHFDILSGEVAAPDDIKYRFAFLDSGSAAFPWVKFKDLVLTSRMNHQIVKEIESLAGRTLEVPERDKVARHLELVSKTFRMEEAITYQELDSIDSPELYTEDDVVEIFIRANSGGTRLGKSDLLFSLLTATWGDVDEQMAELIEALNKGDFAFTRDFILKTCLTLLNQGARYEVDKFRRDGVRERIKTDWKKIGDSIRDVLDFVRERTFIRHDKAIPSYLALIPLIYLRHHYQEAWKAAKGLDTFLLRTLIVGAFSGTPDQLIDDCVAKLNEMQGFDLAEMFGVVRSANRPLELSHERFWHMGYGSDSIHLLFNLWYGNFNYQPAYAGNSPQVDHIFARSLLAKVKTANPETGKLNMMKYRERERNQLANCMLLTQTENGPAGKTDQTPAQWFEGKSEAYLDMHLIPKDRALWNLDRFDDFVIERKRLLSAHFAYLLTPVGA